MKKNDKMVSLRMPREDWSAFSALCKKQRRTASSAVRSFVRASVKRFMDKETEG